MLVNSCWFKLSSPALRWPGSVSQSSVRSQCAGSRISCVSRLLGCECCFLGLPSARLLIMGKDGQELLSLGIGFFDTERVSFFFGRATSESLLEGSCLSVAVGQGGWAASLIESTSNICSQFFSLAHSAAMTVVVGEGHGFLM